MAQTEVEAEIEKMKILEERIKAPSVWSRLPCGIRFEDLQDTRYDDAVTLLEDCYLTEEVTYKALEFRKDTEATEEFVNNARIWMKDKMSLAAVNEETDELVGVLIMRIQEKSSFSRTFSRVKLTYNKNYATIMKFHNKVEEFINFYDKLEVRKYLKVYALALNTAYRHKGLCKEMLKSAVALAANANVPAIVGTFTANRLKEIAAELGFATFKEITLGDYVVDNQVVFNRTSHNSSAALMAIRIPQVRETAETQLQQTSRFNVEKKNEE